MKLRQTVKSIPLLLGLLGLACSRQSPSSKEAQALDREVQHKLERTTITDPKTGKQLVFGQSDVPEEFPDDLPVVPEAELNNYLKAGSAIITTFFTSQSLDDVREFFTQGSALEDQGWEIEITRQELKAFNMNVRKADRSAIIALTVSDDPQVTLISYMAKVE